MRRCAFLTLADRGDFVMDDDLAHAPLWSLGWQVDPVPWNRPGVDWREYEAVVIRSPWDYHYQLEAFLEVLAKIEQSGARLLNGLDIVRWNLRKTYLRDLAARGLSTIPTVWRERLGPGELEGVFAEVGSDGMVIKPVVSASAKGAFRIDATSVRERAGEVEAYFADRALMAQPLARAILDEGEYSLLYLNGEHSHSIRKTPREGDFRVQEEHGGAIRPVTAGDALVQAGHRALAAIEQVPLYARADFVRSNDGQSWWLMELELVEPSLYLRMDPGAPDRFARALVTRMASADPDPRSAS